MIIFKFMFDVTLFIIFNIFFHISDTNFVLIILFNSFYIHRFALLNHYLQHYCNKTQLYKFCSSLLFLDDGSRIAHLEHHLYFNTPRDVDYKIYNPSIKINSHIFKIFTLQYFLDRDKNQIEKKYGYIFFTQLLIYFIYCLLYQHWYSYFFYYFLPLLIAKVINDIRVLTEHYDPILKTGCFKELCGIPLLSYFISPYGFDSHDSHHAKPSRGELVLSKTSFSNNHITELIRIFKHG